MGMTRSKLQQVFHFSASEVIENDNLALLVTREAIQQVAADESRAAGHNGFHDFLQSQISKGGRVEAL